MPSISSQQSPEPEPEPLRPARHKNRPRLRLVAAGGVLLKDLTLRFGSKLLARFTLYRGRAKKLQALRDTLPNRKAMPAAQAPRAREWRLSVGEGRFEIRLTRNPADIDAAQALRYEVFYREMGATPSRKVAARERDFDRFDSICDHLLVLDHARPVGQTVIGTYRLLRQEVAEKNFGFYSTAEYDLSRLIAAVPDGGLLELGRSCVHPAYRTNATIQLLWRGIATYLADHGITYLFGCASLPGVDADALALPLSFLHHNHLAPEPLRVRALPERFVAMDKLAADAVPAKRAVRLLPPLIKGYLRLGAYIGEGAVIDHEFRTTDVFILLPVTRISENYFAHFERATTADINR